MLLYNTKHFCWGLPLTSPHEVVLILGCLRHKTTKMFNSLGHHSGIFTTQNYSSHFLPWAHPSIWQTAKEGKSIYRHTNIYIIDGKTKNKTKAHQWVHAPALVHHTNCLHILEAKDRVAWRCCSHAVKINAHMMEQHSSYALLKTMQLRGAKTKELSKR